MHLPETDRLKPFFLCPDGFIIELRLDVGASSRCGHLVRGMRKRMPPSGLLNFIGVGWNCSNYYRQATCASRGCEWVPESSYRKRHWHLPRQGGRCTSPSRSPPAPAARRPGLEGLSREELRERHRAVTTTLRQQKETLAHLAKETERIASNQRQAAKRLADRLGERSLQTDEALWREAQRDYGPLSRR